MTPTNGNTDKSAEEPIEIMRWATNGFEDMDNDTLVIAMESYATLHASAAVKQAMELIKAQEDYIKFLGQEYEGIHSIAYAHHYRTPKTVFEKGALMRETIKLLKAHLPSPNK